MERIYKVMGVIAGLLLMLILLISATEYIAYYKDGYYEEEYSKYGVTEEINIEMDELLYVTDEMMTYLKGGRDDLVVMAEVNGEEREFFNDKEKSHMADVQGLFLGGIALRRVSAAVVMIIAAALIFKKKAKALLSGVQIGIGVFFACIGVLAGLMAVDFNKYFTLFHKIFFDNDDWLLDPKTDLLINIVPEGFFMDTAFYIAAVFLAGAAAIWLGAFFINRKIKTGE